MIALVILSIGIVMPFYIKPEDTEAATGTATESTMTFTSTRNAASVDITVDSPDGTAVFNDASHNVYFSIKTNNYSGYKVYLSTTNSNVSLVNGSNTIPALASGSNVTKANFTSGSSYNNKWGVIPSYYNSSTNSNVRGLSTTANTDMLLRNTTSANASSAHTYYVGMAVKADYSKASGAYTTSNLVIKYVANPVTYTITYNKNTTDTVSDLPGTQSGSTSGTTVTLSSTVPTRSGAVFIGWCSTTTVSDGGTDTCSGTTYQPGGSYGIDQTTTNTPTLRAMWDTSGCNPAATTIGTGNTATDAVCMQDMNDTIISSMTAGDRRDWNNNYQYKLIDKRDNKEYAISKLMDGKVWMTQNLDLDLSASTTLRHSSTDLGWTTNDATATWTPSQSTSTSAWSSSSTAPRSYDAGVKYYYRSHDNPDLFTYTSLAACEAGVDDGANPDPYCGHAHVGNYYNWRAAVASNSGTISGNAPNSICPAGWRLPGGFEFSNSRTSSDAGVLWYKGEYANRITSGATWVDSYAYTDAERYPIYLVPAGTIAESSSPIISIAGELGRYWTSTTVSGSTTESYTYEYNGSNPFSGYHLTRSYGASVRCIARMSNTGTTTVIFDGNGVGRAMSPQYITGGVAAELTANQYDKSGYVFTGWNTNADGTGTEYKDKDIIYAEVGSTTEIVLYAQWKKVITFATGSNIDLIIVAKQVNGRSPLYATPNNPVTIEMNDNETLMVTVVPKATYKLSSWTGSPSGSASGTFASNTLLTTTFTPGPEASPTWTANGVSGSYTTMQSLSSCSSATNVTDSRNNISYAVGPITVSGTTYCYMLSNLRLGPGVTLTTSDSNVSANTFTTPADSWVSSVCQARMVILNNEYYYNWYAAKANRYAGGTATTCTTTQDGDGASYSLGSICPKNWTLPTYATSGTLTPAGIWSSGTNPGMIMSTGIGGSEQTSLGTYGRWWSATRGATSGNTANAYAMHFNGNTTGTTSRSTYNKNNGFSVRCMKSS